MSTTAQRTPLSWSARLLIGLLLLLVGAGAMVWALGNYPPMARLLGVTREAAVTAPPQRAVGPVGAAAPAPAPAADLGALEARLERVEAATQHAAGSAGRADALLVAFAARRAVDRGVALGYLENLLVQRFGAQHQAAVSTIITASRKPVALSDLIARYETLGPELRRGGPEESWWDGLTRELGGIVQVRRADRPPPDANARYSRALHALSLGRVDQAIAETMRLPGAAGAADWTRDARRYVAAQRALDEIETAALLGDRGAR
jgi:hypothetical protein